MAELSVSQCVLLACQLAAEASIDALRALLYRRRDAIGPELAYQIMLSYLPESLDPALYVNLVAEISSSAFPEQLSHTELDTSSVASLSARQAEKQYRHLRLSPLKRPGLDTQDPLTLFLIQRAHQIDASTGLLTTVPQMLEPFLDRSKTLKTWFISSVLPLLRLEYEYYPQGSTALTIEAFEKLRGPQGLEALLSKTAESPQDSENNIPVRDFRGLVGPWMEGSSKRRKLNDGSTQPASTSSDNSHDMSFEQTAQDVSVRYDWKYAFRWLVQRAATHFPLVSEVFDGWGGVEDVDLGGYAQQELNAEAKEKLIKQYRQAAFATVYAVESDTPETVEGAHSMLCRLATLCDFEPPPELATSIELLPKVQEATSVLGETSGKVLNSEMLLKDGNPLTTPKWETFSLLQMFVYSTYMLLGLGKPLSICNVARHRFHKDAQQQLSLLQEVLRKQVAAPKKTTEAWHSIRRTLLWLWNWGIDADGIAQFGTGILGKIDRASFESEILKTLIATSMFDVVTQVYIEGDASVHRLHLPEVEEMIVRAAMSLYDNANSCNRNHGGLKKASDMIAAFSSHFGNSTSLKRMRALLLATHALSSYSLVLQHGVPFQPVNIRVSSDPLGLLAKVLSQNRNSYAELDNLISIGRNLVAAGLPYNQSAASVSGLEPERPDSPAEHADAPIIDPPPTQLIALQDLAERRVISMAIKSALDSDDFETAYSYVINRLKPASTPRLSSPPNPSLQESHSPHPATFIEPFMDEFSWRAAFNTGRYRPSSTSSSRTANAHNALRQTEQRKELLSQALALAPEFHLPEILTVWRRCEEEETALLAREEAAEKQHADRGDRRVPGGFGGVEEERMFSLPQTRREVGRSAREEAPLGLFDVAKGAAAALGRTAFPLRGTNAATKDTTANANTATARSSMEEARGHANQGSDGEGRVRKRDLLFNATTGATDALAGGIGWVLGAKPVRRDEGAG